MITSLYYKYRDEINWPNIFLGTLALSSVVILFSFIILKFGATVGYDWNIAYKPAIELLLSGQSPYNEKYFYNPPWALIPLIPFYFLPTEIAGFLQALLTMAVFALVSYRLGASPLAMALILLSPPTLHLVRNSNIEWLVALGFILPPQMGLFFVILKPQLGIGIALFWALQTWREKGVIETIKTFAPVTITLLLSFVLYGFWPARNFHSSGSFYDFSVWPWGILGGIALIAYALFKNDVRYSIAASPMLSPYIAAYSWTVPMLGMSKHKWITLAVFLGMWLFHFLVRSWL